MLIEPFAVEIWMNEWENRATSDLGETCVDPLTVEELLAITETCPDELTRDLMRMRLTYGAIEGSNRLRTAIAAQYTAQHVRNVIVTHGAIGANALLHQALIDPGDHVVSVVPAYQQHYSIPTAIGAHVDRVWLREENGWLLDPDELASAVTARTKMICLTNPNNPTGALIDEQGLVRIADIASATGAYVLCDEVYRGTDDAEPGRTASMADLYERGISTGSMSKSFSMAGVRLGWIVAPPEVIAAVSIHRDYNTISVGMIDDLLASLALERAEDILVRSRGIGRRHRDIVDEWVCSEPLIEWVRPQSGTTALLRYDLDLPSHQLCTKLIEEEGVLMTPGSALGVEGCIRIGYCGKQTHLEEGLTRVSALLHR